MTKGQKLLNWVDERFPLSSMLKEHVTEYYAPKNFNFWYFFGSLAMLVLVIQIVTGIFLTMNYKPDGTLNGAGIPVAFASVEYIMRDVAGGWIIRYMHSTGASMFFVVVYLHMFRGLIYGSYKQPRELVWVFGTLIFLCLMAEAFMGYLLPWGQMSFWGAQVIVNLFGSIPVIGPDLSVWIRGDYVVSDATLNRFFALHVIAVPLVLLALVVAHLIALHEVGSNNPDGVEIKKLKDDKGIPLDGIPFHPYYTVKDVLGVVVFLIVFSAIVFFMPEMGGYFLEKPNFDQADPLKTPPHIAPVWYFTPFYAILRAIPSFLGTQVWGVIAMGAAVVLIAFLPWLDRSPVKSIRYRGPKFKFMLVLFIVSFIGLGILGALPSTNARTVIAQVLSFIYFVFFLGMPFYTKNDVGSIPVPTRVTDTNAKRQIRFAVLVVVTVVAAAVFAMNV
ncbi:ubiquinol-cytochrome c reductase cytochrome b subunit [Chromobacterium alkanivorans]|uniref:cytochrome b n=1 Tax=Chromobacterium TaxID=535 RepID=UPI0006541B88|nr:MULTISPECIES: cytochrome bc complex cytochrome b subunit [Chromobacterium]KMN81750.1 cytochrome B [Chromobacterium sp. LK11]MBN3002644.1 cytochrome bc complex cytochrome b subunit [Chromobacterium alkanivorans]MCS3802714.1 ubiquinol-cytochrome c reductase cytochrome b subunit [Chromobacterium alkanivorans]MCS3817040.1 ubiquinol-cytochrome c reductase cytochrome b subunit [Chromobacterium alkanivorans]MCS3872080.1 ubiquinol-cytochrome c reductase cytochrome b subunit [Chromobacterium alkaniv